MDYMRLDGGIITVYDLCGTTGVKTTPKTDRVALKGGLLQVGCQGGRPGL